MSKTHIMKQVKYLNAVLTVIAFCLVIITLSVTGLIPIASAQTIPNNNKTVQDPVNNDGSITVKFAANQKMDVNLASIRGFDMSSSPLKVDIEEVGGYKTYGKLPVEIKK